MDNIVNKKAEELYTKELLNNAGFKGLLQTATDMYEDGYFHMEAIKLILDRIHEKLNGLGDWYDED